MLDEVNDPERLRAVDAVPVLGAREPEVIELLELGADRIHAVGMFAALRERAAWRTYVGWGDRPSVVPLDDPVVAKVFESGDQARWPDPTDREPRRTLLERFGEIVGVPFHDLQGNRLGVLLALGVSPGGRPAVPILRMICDHLVAHMRGIRDRRLATDLTAVLIDVGRSLDLPVPVVSSGPDPSANRGPVDALAETIMLQTRLLGEATRAARLGAWRVEVGHGTLRWSPEVRRIHEVPSSFEPDVQSAIAFYTPECRPALERAFQRAVGSATPYDLELEIDTYAGNRKIVRSIGHPIRDVMGRVIGVQGAFQDLTPIRAVERAADEARAQLERVLAGMSDALMVFDEEWRFVFVNEQAGVMLRRAPSEMLGTIVWESFPAAVGGPFQDCYERARATGRPQSVTAWYEPLQAWFQARALPAQSGLAVFFRDVTQERERDRELAERRQQLQILADLAHEVVLDWDITADRIAWSTGFRELTQGPVPASEAGLSSWVGLLHPEERGDVVASLWAAVRGDASQWEITARLVRADGAAIPVAHNARILRTEEGVATRLIGGLRDLSAERERDLRLQQQAALIDEVPAAIFVVESTGRVRSWSRGASSLYGWSRDRAIGRDIGELLGVDPAEREAWMHRCVASRSTPTEAEYARSDGTRVTVEARWTPLDGQGTLLGVHVDIGERKRLEEQFLRSQRLDSIGTLAGGIAHDLNNVLTPVLVSAELLRARETDPARDELLATIEHSALRGAELLKQVLAFASGADGRHHRLDLAQLLHQLRRLVRETFPPTVAIELTAEPVVIRGDATQLHQVFVNLLLNARDAMPSGGTIRISAESVELAEGRAELPPGAAPGRYARVEVEDEGEGIAQEHLSRIFDPFFTTKHPGKGTGLGLSTMAAIVRSHEGFVQVDSEVGRGARFAVYLPALSSTEEPSDQGSDDADPDEPAAGAGRTILLVDDERLVRDIAARTLESHGYRVVAAEDGAQALAIYARDPSAIDLVLTDMVMPVMDGPALIHAVRRIRPDVRLVAASGYSADGRATRAAGLGVEHFLAKPFSADALLRMVADALLDGSR